MKVINVQGKGIKSVVGVPVDYVVLRAKNCCCKGGKIFVTHNADGSYACECGECEAPNNTTAYNDPISPVIDYVFGECFGTERR